MSDTHRQNRDMQRNVFPQNTTGQYKIEDGRESPESKGGIGQEARAFDDALRDLIKIAMPSTDLENSKNTADMVTIISKPEFTADVDNVEATYKNMELSWSKNKWKGTIQKEINARAGQRRQIYAVKAIDEVLKDRMSKG